jgi:hypothetical protein
VPYVDDEIFYSLCLRLFLTTGARDFLIVQRKKIEHGREFLDANKSRKNVTMAMTLKIQPRTIIMSVISLHTHDYSLM